MGAAVMKQVGAPVYDGYLDTEVVAHEKFISADEAYSYRSGDWAKLSDSEFYQAIMARANDARNRPRKPWRESINEVFNSPKRRYANV